MEAIDFRRVVNQAGDRVERREGVIVDQSAREILIDRAQANEAEVYKALSDRGLTEQDLEHAAVDQFAESVNIYRQTHRDTLPRGRPIIDATIVAEGMRRRCHFVPWC